MNNVELLVVVSLTLLMAFGFAIHLGWFEKIKAWWAKRKAPRAAGPLTPPTPGPQVKTAWKIWPWMKTYYGKTNAWVKAHKKTTVALALLLGLGISYSLVGIGRSIVITAVVALVILSLIKWKWHKKLQDMWAKKPKNETTDKSDKEEFGPQWSEAESVVYSIAICLAVYLSLLSVTLLLFGAIESSVKVGQTTLVWNWALFHLVAVLVWAGSSFQTIDADINAVKKCFGRIVQEMGPGIVFAPRWIFSITKVTARVIALVGGTPEKVKAAGRGEAIPEGAVVDVELIREEGDLELKTTGPIRVSEEPMRITFAEADKALYLKEDELKFRDTKNPLAIQHTTDPIIVIGLMFPKAGTRRLVRRFGNTYVALKRVTELMTSHLQILCSKVTPEYFIYRIGDFALMLQLILETMIEDENMMPNQDAPRENLRQLGINIENIKSIGKTGINIKTVTLQAGLSKKVNEAFRDRVQQYIRIEVAQNEGEQNRITLEKAGQGKAAATKAEKLALADGVRANLESEAAGRAALINVTNNEMGRLLAQLDAVATALGQNSKVVIAPNATEILGSFAAIQQTLKQLAEEDKAKPLPPTAPTATT